MISCQHQHCQEEAVEAAEQVCADLGAKFTDQRRKIFEIIWENHKE